MDIYRRTNSAIAMMLVLCLMVAGTYLLMSFLGGGLRAPYQIVVNGKRIHVNSMQGLEAILKPSFPGAVSVRVYNPSSVLVEDLVVTQEDLCKPEGRDFWASLDRGTKYDKLKMYAEPDFYDLFIRKVGIDRETFGEFVAGVFKIGEGGFGEHAKVVLLR